MQSVAYSPLRCQRINSLQVYIYRWNRMGRKGQRCIVMCRGTMNSCWVRFEDGLEAVTSRNALRKALADSSALPKEK